MALKARLYKANLDISDLDRNYYASHSLSLACHPSETEQRLMIRLLAFALYATDSLAFTRGLSSDDEPDLWDRDLTGQITHWIEVGLPDEHRVRKGCNRADKATVLSYGPNTAGLWWDKHRAKFSRQAKLQVLYLDEQATTSLAAMVARTMAIQVTVQDGEVWFSDPDRTAVITPQIWQVARP